MRTILQENMTGMYSIFSFMSLTCVMHGYKNKMDKYLIKNKNINYLQCVSVSSHSSEHKSLRADTVTIFL
jgi:hypothetical protein